MEILIKYKGYMIWVEQGKSCQINRRDWASFYFSEKLHTSLDMGKYINLRVLKRITFTEF